MNDEFPQKMDQEEKKDIPPVEEPVAVAEVKVEVPEPAPAEPVVVETAPPPQTVEPVQEEKRISLDQMLGDKKVAKKSTNAQVFIFNFYL